MSGTSRTKSDSIIVGYLMATLRWYRSGLQLKELCPPLCPQRGPATCPVPLGTLGLPCGELDESCSGWGLSLGLGGEESSPLFALPSSVRAAGLPCWCLQVELNLWLEDDRETTASEVGCVYIGTKDWISTSSGWSTGLFPWNKLTVTHFCFWDQLVFIYLGTV